MFQGTACIPLVSAVMCYIYDITCDTLSVPSVLCETSSGHPGTPQGYSLCIRLHAACVGGL